MPKNDGFSVDSTAQPVDIPETKEVPPGPSMGTVNGFVVVPEKLTESQAKTRQKAVEERKAWKDMSVKEKVFSVVQNVVLAGSATLAVAYFAACIGLIVAGAVLTATGVGSVPGVPLIIGGVSGLFLPIFIGGGGAVVC